MLPRPRLALLLTVVWFVVASCGGETPAVPLDQRILLKAEVPDEFEQKSEFDWTTASEVAGEGLTATQEDATGILEDAGFVAGAARVYGTTAPEENLISMVLQFDSADGAVQVQEWTHDQELLPCQGICAVRIEEFDVDDIPDALGASRTLIPEGAGAEQVTYDRYIVAFTDGPFVYIIERASTSRTATREDAIGPAQALYERVQDAPLASG